MRLVSPVGLFLLLHGWMPGLVAQESQIRLRLDTGEARVALAVLDARAAGGFVPESLWARLEASEGYGRLAERERSMGRELTVAEFRSFLLQDSMLPRRDLLRGTLAAWSTMPVAEAGARALAYLPPGTPLAANGLPPDQAPLQQLRL